MANPDFPRGFIPRKGCDKIEYYDLSPANPEIGWHDLIERRADGFVYPAQVGSTTIIGSAAAHIDANTGGKLPVYDAVHNRYIAQMDDASFAAQTDLDLNYDIVVGAPDPITGRSIMEIDGSTKALTATLPIKVLNLVPSSEFGANAAVEVIINNHLFKSTGVIG